MNDITQGPPGAGSSRSGLESRLSEIERRLGRIEEGRIAPEDRLAELEAELGVLRQAVEDLAAGNLDLNNQLIKLVSSCERILAGTGSDALASGRRSGIQRSVSFVRRIARRTVQGTIGAARRLAGSHPSGPETALEVEIELGSSPAGPAPSIALIVRTSDDPAGVGLPADLRRQTEPDLVVVVWNERRSAAAVHGPGAAPECTDAPDRAAVAALTSAGLVADVTLPLPRLHPTLLERCRWTIASEGLPLEVADLAAGSSPGGRIEPTARWVARAGTGKAPPQPKLVKIVGSEGWGALDRAGSPVAGAGLGRGYAVRQGSRGKVVHRVAPVAGVAAPFPPGDARPAALVVAPPGSGAVTAWLLRSLADEIRFTVVLPGDADGSPLERALTEVVDRVYPLAGFLEPEVWPSLVADLARAHDARTVVRIGGAVDLDGFGETRPIVVDLPLHRSEVDGGADLVIALGGEIGEEALRQGLETVALVPGPGPAGEIPEAGELASVRAAYGVPEDARLVLAACDLEPASRPEDVTAVARRLRHLEDVHVLLVGRGSLAGSISDLAGYFELDRFSLASAGHRLTELAAVSDCVLSTAELDPWPVAVGAAFALGRSVVATEIDGVRELAAAAGYDRCVLCPPGDVDALAAAVIDALANHRKPRATKKAWSAAAARRTAAVEVIREALGRGPDAGSESR